MRQTLRLGSLFDGSGGFPLAATKVGIEPVWASEIEPFPILVTTTRFPQMQHLGNICDIDGSQLEPVVWSRLVLLAKTCRWQVKEQV